MPSLLGLVDSVTELLHPTERLNNDSSNASAPDQLSEKQIQDLWQTHAHDLKDQLFVQEAHRSAWHAAWQSLNGLPPPNQRVSNPEVLRSQVQQAFLNHDKTWMEPLSHALKTSVKQLLADDSWAETETAPRGPQTREQGPDKPVLLYRARQLPTGFASTSPPESLNDNSVDLLASNSTSQVAAGAHDDVNLPCKNTPANALANILRLDDDEELNEQDDDVYQDLLNTDGSLLDQLHYKDLEDSCDGGGPETGWHCLHDDGAGAPSTRAEKVIQSLQVALSDHDDDAVLVSMRSLLGKADCDILPEGIITCSAWPQLCQCLTTTLITATTQPSKLGNQMAQLIVRLVMSLATECCCISPAHTVQLLQAIAIPLVTPVSVSDALSCELLLKSNNSHLLVKEHAPVLLLAAPGLQLLQSTAHDWHLIGCVQQEQLAEVIINMVATALMFSTEQHNVPFSEEPQGMSHITPTTTSTAMTCQLTALHIMLSMDPHMQCLQRMFSAANSSQQFAHASFKPINPSILPFSRPCELPSYSLLDSPMNIHQLIYKLLCVAHSRQHVTVQQLHQVGLLTCVSCQMLCISETRVFQIDNQQSRQGSKAVTVNDIVKVMLSLVCMKVDRQCGECIETWLKTIQKLLCDVAENVPSLWQVTDLHNLFRQALSPNNSANQHQQQLIHLAIAVCSSLSMTSQGCAVLLTQPEGFHPHKLAMISVFSDLLQHPSYPAISGCTLQLVEVLIRALHHAADMQVQLQYATQLAQLIVQHLVFPALPQKSVRHARVSDLTSASLPSSVASATAAEALNLLGKLLCAVPSLLIWLEQQPSALLCLLADYLVASLVHEQQENNLEQGSSMFDSCVARQGVAGVLAISKKMQALLIEHGWLHQLLFKQLPFQLNPPSAFQQALGGPNPSCAELLQLHSTVYGGSSSCQAVIPAMSAVQATLSWHGICDLLTVCSNTSKQQKKEFKGTVVMRALVSWLYVSPDPGLSTTTQMEAAGVTQSDRHPPTSGACLPAGLLHETARSIALICLNTWAHNPHVLRALQDTTNVQWYLEQVVHNSLISDKEGSLQSRSTTQTCISQDKPTLTPNNLMYDHDIQMATSILHQIRQASNGAQSKLLGNAQVRQQHDKLCDKPARPPSPSSQSPAAALPEVVKGSAGMHDPLAWLDAASHAIQSDIHHECGISIPSVGLLLQRTVLVAWPGICSMSPASSPAQWACSDAGSKHQPGKAALGRLQTGPVGSPGDTPQHFTDCVSSALAMLQSAPHSAWMDGNCSTPDLAAWLHAICTAQGWDASPGTTSTWGGDAFLVVVGLLLGAGRPGSYPSSARLGVEFLQGLMQSPSSAYLWPLHNNSGTNHSTCTALSSAICSSVQWVLCRSEPCLWAALGGAGSIGWTVVLHQVIDWLGFSSSPAPGRPAGIAWCGVLDGQQVVWALLLSLVCGPDYLVYCCVAVSLPDMSVCLNPSASTLSLLTSIRMCCCSLLLIIPCLQEADQQ